MLNVLPQTCRSHTCASRPTRPRVFSPQKHGRGGTPRITWHRCTTDSMAARDFSTPQCANHTYGTSELSTPCRLGRALMPARHRTSHLGEEWNPPARSGKPLLCSTVLASRRFERGTTSGETSRRGVAPMASEDSSLGACARTYIPSYVRGTASALPLGDLHACTLPSSSPRAYVRLRRMERVNLLGSDADTSAARLDILTALRF
ncbi:hypothetical protein OH76DRAFT_852845 [Lentinus brumalis]|uniref:Uncharacterized protein n=1 Tax=Lentinus brumalis TaxID=2498619 RepID=A0A371DQX6_9APHY|nr:hypothetical protein OH76DRAFT_852845 [Polyporus brumalis]